MPIGRSHAEMRFICCRDKQETHRLAERKQQQMAKLENAFGLSNVVEGEAFNRELQEERKLQVHACLCSLCVPYKKCDCVRAVVCNVHRPTDLGINSSYCCMIDVPPGLRGWHQNKKHARSRAC